MKKNVRHSKIAAIILTAISVALIVGGFFVPPMGVIDGSVLTAVGLMLAFGALFAVLDAMAMGVDAKLSHNDTTIEINNDKR